MQTYNRKVLGARKRATVRVRDFFPGKRLIVESVYESRLESQMDLELHRILAGYHKLFDTTGYATTLMPLPIPMYG